MNIVIAINKKYIKAAKTMLFSVFYNNTMDNIRVFLFFSDLDDKDICQLREFIEDKGNAALCEVKIPHDIFLEAPLKKWWSREMYFRLLAHEYIMEDRALWLDADIIVNGNISTFYHQPIDDYYCVACKGCNQARKQELSLPEEHIYFNSGVLLLNLKKIRETFIREDFIRCVKKYEDALTTPDQDVLNIMFAGKVKYADEALYNHETFGFGVMTKQELNIIVHKAYIIHYNGPIKPWNAKGANWADRLWWKYEIKQKHYVAFAKYRIQNTPIKIFYVLREMYYIIMAQIRKIKGKRKK